MNKKYLILCNRHDSIFGKEWCLFWGNRESKQSYTCDLRIAHRFDETEVGEFTDNRDIPVPIELLGISEDYEPVETYNKNIHVLVEKAFLLNKLNIPKETKNKKGRMKT